MSMTELLVTGLAGLVLLYFFVWLVQLRTRNAGIIDAVWAFSLGLLALFYGLCADGNSLARALVATGGLVWGLRLAWHLWLRNSGHAEDARYRQLREEWGLRANQRMLGFFLIQALAAIFLSLAFLLPAQRVVALAAWQITLAILVWMIAVIGEALADHQLRKFLALTENHGRVCDVGLWRYSRHPNYFFECLHWLAYIPLTIDVSWGWVSLLPPVMMAYLLIKVSGIPMLEEHLLRTRPSYTDYQRRTSMLLPWIPRTVKR